jgi:hypothetical protein
MCKHKDYLPLHTIYAILKRRKWDKHSLNQSPKKPRLMSLITNTFMAALICKDGDLVNAQDEKGTYYVLEMQLKNFHLFIISHGRCAHYFIKVG